VPAHAYARGHLPRPHGKVEKCYDVKKLHLRSQFERPISFRYKRNYCLLLYSYFRGKRADAGGVPRFVIRKPNTSPQILPYTGDQGKSRSRAANDRLVVKNCTQIYLRRGSASDPAGELTALPKTPSHVKRNKLDLYCRADFEFRN